MQAFNFKKQLCAIALLLLSSVGASVQAATLSVNCGGTYGLTNIVSVYSAHFGSAVMRPDSTPQPPPCLSELRRTDHVESNSRTLQKIHRERRIHLVHRQIH